MKHVVYTLLTLVIVFVAYSFYVSRPVVNTEWDSAIPHVIAEPDEALTFARSGSSLIRVTGLHDGIVKGIDISAAIGNTDDLIEAYAGLGYEGIAAATGPEVTILVKNLTTPVDYHYPHVAAGTNFSEHADEVHLDEQPFLFPKLAQATAWNTPVDFHPRLDFEAELAMVPLSDIQAADDKVEFGLVLCNDFTDRWTLIRQLDLGEPMGTTGFAAAKGIPSFLPTGYLFVIPKSPAFHESITLELAVNGMARQRFKAGDMILKIDDIVAQAFAQVDRPFFDGDKPVSLLPSGSIPRGTLILTGTSAGVLFKPVNLWNPGFYLQRGDRVVTRATYLGQLDSQIE